MPAPRSDQKIVRVAEFEVIVDAERLRVHIALASMNLQAIFIAVFSALAYALYLVADSSFLLVVTLLPVLLAGRSLAGRLWTRARPIIFDKKQGGIFGGARRFGEISELVGIDIEDANGVVLDDTRAAIVAIMLKRPIAQDTRSTPPYHLRFRFDDRTILYSMVFSDLSSARLMVSTISEFIDLRLRQIAFPDKLIAPDPHHLEMLHAGPERWNEWRRSADGRQPVLSGAMLQGRDLSDYEFGRSRESPLRTIEHNRVIGVGESFFVTVAIRDDPRTPTADLADSPTFEGTRLDDANLSKTKCKGANFTSASLSKVDFSEAMLEDSIFDFAKLDSAILTGSNASRASFCCATLKSAYLHDAKFESALFVEASLDNASLLRAVLRDARLDKASLRSANLRQADLRGARLRGADLQGADLEYALLIDCDAEGTNFDNARVYGCSVWNIHGTPRSQRDIVVTREGEPLITVDNLKIAQFVYLLLRNEEMRGVIDALTSKMVLILGRFTPERKQVLDRLRDRIRDLGFIPMMFDFEPSASQDFVETVQTLAHLSAFIFADLSSPAAVPVELQAIVPTIAVPVIPLIAADQRPYVMFNTLSKYHWVLSPIEYIGVDDLCSSVTDAAVASAISKRRELAVQKTESRRAPR